MGGGITRETDSMGGGGWGGGQKCGAKQEVSVKCKAAPQRSVTADQHAMSGHSPKVPHHRPKDGIASVAGSHTRTASRQGRKTAQLRSIMIIMFRGY